MSQSMHSHMMTSSNGDIFRVTGPLCGEFTGHRWIHRTKASDTELWSMFSLIWVWINAWVNNREAGNVRRHRAHYDVIAMMNHDYITIYSFALPLWLKMDKMSQNSMYVCVCIITLFTEYPVVPCRAVTLSGEAWIRTHTTVLTLTWAQICKDGQK